MWISFLLWPALGALVGYVAAKRRGLSLVVGILAGLVLGPLAWVLFLVPGFALNAVRQQRCPYCAGSLTPDARVCHHCQAILTREWK